ncbi:MAG: endonuclease, partial [Spirochaetales bacterium]|nr:endonuclease [Spirochaetales bacterium]
KTWYDDMLRAWAAADPVSDKERVRNNAVQAHQDNRNPFIDYPELLDLLDLEN